jgi:hypothetical protein
MIIAVRVAIADLGVAVVITAKGIGTAVIGMIGASGVREQNVGRNHRNWVFSPGF